MKQRSSRGTIIYAVGAFTMIMIIILLFLLSQAQVLKSFQQHQSAAESASLFVAREICSVTIASSVGQIGLVDLSPSDNRNPFFKQNGNTNQVPVTGINTALATVRLDLLIARDLKNDDMITLAQRDLTELKSVGKSLQKAITDLLNQRGANTLFERTMAIYEQNTNAATGKLRSDSFKILLGQLSKDTTTTDGTTNIPLPVNPDAVAQNNSSGGFYKPYVNIPVKDDSFAFAAIGTEPRLVDNSKFASLSTSGILSQLPPTVIQIQADHDVTSPVDGSTINGVTDHAVSTAEAGGTLLAARSTVYSLGFAGGFPSTKTFEKLTVRTLLDFDGWRPAKNQQGTWLRNTSSQFHYPAGNGGEGLLASQDFRDPTKISTTQSPSTALAYGIYDWLRSLRLRPNRDEVVKAINTGDLRQLGSEVRQYAGPTANDGNPDSADTTEANRGEELQVPKLDPVESGSPAPVDLVNNYRGSITSSMFRDGDLIDARFNALTGKEAGGPDLYLDAFDYKSIDAVRGGEQAPQTSPALNTDSTDGSAISTSGQSSGQVTQFVQGVIATNRAALTSRIGGRMALVEALQADLLFKGDANKGTAGNPGSTPTGPFNAALQQHKQNQKQRLHSEGILEPHAIIAELTPDKCFREVLEDIKFAGTYLTNASATVSLDTIAASAFLRSSSTDLKTLITSYLSLPVIKNSPVQEQNRAKLNQYLNINVTRADVNLLISNSLTVEGVINIESQRMSAIRRRGEQCLLNGQIAYARTNNILRRLKRFTAHGVRRLENEGSKEAPAFAINMLNPEVPADLNKPSTRIVYIMPNNGQQGNVLGVQRVLGITGPNFYNLQPVSRTEADNFKVLIEQVKSSDTGVVFVADRDRLSSGSEIMPLIPGATSLALAPPGTGGPAVFQKLGRFLRYSWDTAADEDRSDIGRYALRYLKKKHVVGGNLLKTFDQQFNIIDFVTEVTRAGLRKDAAQAREKLFPTVAFNQQGLSGSQPDREVPAFERVFVLGCKGNAANDPASGTIVLLPVKPSLDQQSRYPFGKSALVSGQYLYFSGNCLNEGIDSKDKLDTVRSVIGRDLFVDLGKGNQFNLQDANDWCNRYHVDLGDENNATPPYLAGEFRLGSALCLVKEPVPGGFDINISPSLRNAPETISESAIRTIDIAERDDYQVIPSISPSNRRPSTFGTTPEQLGEPQARPKLPL